MIEPELLRELQVAWAACLGGAMITFVYDVLRIFRRVCSHGNLLIAIEDLLFWIWTAFWIFSVFYRLNDGNIRIYTMCAMGTGMIIYHKIISEVFVKVFSTLLRPVFGVLFFPVKILKKITTILGNKLKHSGESVIMDNRGDSE